LARHRNRQLQRAEGAGGTRLNRHPEPGDAAQLARRAWSSGTLSPRIHVLDFLQQGSAYPLHDPFDHLLVGRGEPARLRRRFRAGLLLDVLFSTSFIMSISILVARKFIDQLSDDRFALGDLTTLPVNRNEYGLVQRVDQQPPAGSSWADRAGCRIGPS
jgi:hypothetical protein